MFYASGVTQGISTSAADAVFRAIDVVKSAGGAVAYDTNYRPKLWPPARAAATMHAAMARVDIAFPGMEDAAVLTGLAEPQAILDFYLRLGPKVVALKMGADGAWIATPDARTHIPAFTVDAVDASGAGDAFCGAFMARTLAGDDPVAAGRYAAVAAALKCTFYGCVAPIPRADAVRAALCSPGAGWHGGIA
jgi:2-dehydro-3-deoxygluconokinase